MVGTRRRARTNTPLQAPPSRKRTRKTSIVTPCEGRKLKECVSQVSRDLLTNFFLRIWPHIWYSVLPSEGGISDISGGTKQKWDHLLPLLLHIGLVEVNEKNSKGYNVILTKWDEFVYNFWGSLSCTLSPLGEK